jgi:PRC-barrel domain
MLDVRRGQIAYAVLSFGGTSRMGDKLFAVPWSALILDTDRECFVLDILKERLENAPGFDQDHWPSMADPGWQSEIDRYYGARSYWE